MTSQKPCCPLCGAKEYHRAIKPLTLTYKGHSLTIQQPGFWCESCGEGVMEGKDIKATREALHSFMEKYALYYTHDTALNTQEAADLLNVSQSYLINLLKMGKIPYRKVGTQRKMLFKDVMEYKKHDDKKRLQVLNKLTKEAQLLDAGYENN